MSVVRLSNNNLQVCQHTVEHRQHTDTSHFCSLSLFLLIFRLFFISKLYTMRDTLYTAPNTRSAFRMLKIFESHSEYSEQQDNVK